MCVYRHCVMAAHLSITALVCVCACVCACVLGVGRYQFYTWQLLPKPSITVMASITVIHNYSTTILYH